MSQNGPYPGPPWSSGGGSAEEPYAEPSDPWGDHPPAATAPPWGIPQQPTGYPGHAPGGWAPPPPPAPRRNTPMIALVVTLGVLIVAGLGATLWILNGRNAATPVANSSAPAAADPLPAPRGSEDARFVKKGDCVVNEGTDEKPEMRSTGCTSGTYLVLERVEGQTGGKKDAEDKCAKVKGYTKWYFYDSQLDDLDFVLCLKEHG